MGWLTSYKEVPEGRGKGVEQLRVAGTGLPLTSAVEVAAPRDEETRQDDGEDRGQSCAEGRPMNVDE